MGENIGQHENEHEQTIEPISPGFAKRGSSPAAHSAPGIGPSSKNFWLAIGASALIAVLLGVFFLLPQWLADPEPVPTVVAVSEVETVPDDGGPILSAEELAALEAQSQRELARLLTQQDTLESLAVDRWGGEDWERYEGLSRGGDDAYLRDDFAAAVAAYLEALDLGDALISKSSQIIANALADADTALEAGDADTAMRQFNIVLGIEEGHRRALAGKARAERLPEVLALVREAAQLDDDGELPAAIDGYAAALAIDPAWSPARASLADAKGRLDQYQFDELLSKGYAALAGGNFQVAIEQFTSALTRRAGDREAEDGLFQAEEGLRLGQIALAEIRALAFERRELWPQAIEQYRAALETDATLEYAIQGLARSQVRQDLDAKIMNLLDNPRLLFDDTILADAGVLLDQAAGIPEQGQRIQDQRERLDRLVRLASTPLPIVLESDAMTEVTLYRVGVLGSFLATEVELRPGEYTAVGSRNGYRDVRMSFTVLPGEPLGPVRIVCVEPI